MNDYNKGLLPEPCMRLPYGWGEEWKSIELGDGTGYVRLDDKRETCHMRLAYEEEDADGFIWPDHYECDVCGASVNGIMPYYDTEIPPKFCPNCGRRVIDQDARDLRDAIASDDGKRYSMQEVMDLMEDGE